MEDRRWRRTRQQWYWMTLQGRTLAPRTERLNWQWESSSVSSYKDKNKRSVIFFYTKRSSGCKNIYIISNSIIRSEDSSKRYGQEVAVLKEQLRQWIFKKYNNLRKHHITDLKEQEKWKYLWKYILLLISMKKMKRRQVQEKIQCYCINFNLSHTIHFLLWK